MSTPRGSVPGTVPSSRRRTLADRRLPSALAGLLAIVLVTTGLAWTFLGLSLRSMESVLRDRVEALALIHTVNDEMQHLMADMAIKADRGVVSSDSASRSVRGARDRAQTAWNTYLETWFTDEESRLVTQITPVIETGFATAGALADTLDSGGPEQLTQFLDGSFFPELDAFSASLRELVALQVQVTRESHALSQARFKIAGRAFLGAIVAACALIMVALLAGARRSSNATRRWNR